MSSESLSSAAFRVVTSSVVPLRVDVPDVLRVENRPSPISERLWRAMVQFGLSEDFARLLQAFSTDGARSIPLCWVWRSKYLVQYDPQGVEGKPFVLGVDGPHAALRDNLDAPDGFHLRLFADGTTARRFDAGASSIPFFDAH